jgi:hypothetical protein
LTNELTDTDTVETEPFKATPVEIPDANIDYLSEADMYIRYGMENEALQQVNFALRLQPDNVEAHIKKAEVLYISNNPKGFEEAVTVADSVLAGVALERFRSAVVDLKDSDASADDEEKIALDATADGFGPLIFEEPGQQPGDQTEDNSGNQMEDMLEMDDREATQELDDLLSKLSDDEDEKK